MAESDVPVLDCDSLCVRYGDGSIGVAEVSLSVGKGEIVALLGPNGAGKSTTLRALSGVLPSERVRFENGTVRFAGREVGAWRPHQAVQAGVVLLAEREKVFADLTVEENLRAVNCRRARSRQVSERAYVYELFPSLARRRDAKAGMLSGGERQMLAIGRAILLEPVVLLADEVSLGVTPAVSARLMQIIATLRTDKGVSVLLVEQGVSAALAVADRAMVLERGRVVLSGTPSELMTDKGFVDRYLGIETTR